MGLIPGKSFLERRRDQFDGAIHSKLHDGNCGIADVWSSTFLFKSSLINWNSISTRKGENSLLIRLRQAWDVTVPSMGTGPNASALLTAIYTVTFSCWSALKIVSLGFSEAQNLTFCLLIYPFLWKCASSESHVAQKAPRVSTRSAPCALTKLWHLDILASDSG
jgi:hypothetical protein